MLRQNFNEITTHILSTKSSYFLKQIFFLKSFNSVLAVVCIYSSSMTHVFLSLQSFLRKFGNYVLQTVSM